MTKILLSLTALCLMIVPVSGQTSLLPEDGFEVATWLPEYPNVGAFDISDTLIYLSDGDTIHMLDMNSGSEVKNFGLPEDYSSTHYVSFLSVSPEGNSIWTGYTSTGNLDDRIYSVDVETGQWEFQATFPGNMDLVFWKDSILVSDDEVNATGDHQIQQLIAQVGSIEKVLDFYKKEDLENIW